MDRGDRDGAKLHFAEKQIQLTKNKENRKPVLAAWTTARKGNPNMERAKSPDKKPIQSQKKTIDSWALQTPIIVCRKGREGKCNRRQWH